MNDDALRLKLCDVLCDAARKAGLEIMQIYQQMGDITASYKQDGSPLTIADQQAHHIIEAMLQHHFADIPIISEEGTDRSEGLPRYFLVDPLDGTKEFIKKTGEFTVNIALIENGMPIAGVIYVPAMQKLYFTKNGQSYRQMAGESAEPIHITTADKQAIKAVVSKSHLDAQTEEFLTKFTLGQKLSAGSSLKLCLLAEGLADIYPRFGRTMEWDIAAGHAILQQAGGNIFQCDGKPFRYSKTDYANDDGFIAYGDCRLVR